jgi:hypothetical protein
MGALGEFSYGAMDLTCWGVQILLIAVVSRRAGGPIRLREPDISFCLLVLCCCWVLRLAHLFGLASNGFMYWIGDDPLRWLIAWSWMDSPGEWPGGINTWMPATYFLHGIVMALIPNPLYASKLLSATYSLMSLVGVFVFAQALFRSRVVSVASVMLLAPFWIDILLSTGTMTEMPTLGALLGGAAALLFGLRLPIGRRRLVVLLVAGVSFAIATMFHMVAWIQLTGILLFVLPVFLREKHGTLLERLRSWVTFCALSTSCCFVWLIGQWIMTGSPFTSFRKAGDLNVFKIGGALDLLDVLGGVASAGGVAIVVLAILALAALFFSLLVRPHGDGRVFGRIEVAQLIKARWIMAIVAVMLCVLAVVEVEGWLGALSPKVRELLVANWGVFPVSLVYCLHYYLPLVFYGVFAVLFKRNEHQSEARLVLACIVWILAILVATSVSGGANLSPFRTVLTLSAALVPFAIAFLFDRSAEQSRGELPDGRTPIANRLGIAIAVLALTCNVMANHIRI